MICSRPLALLLTLTLGFSVGLPSPAQAESPIEKLHKKLFGSDDRRRDDDKKKDKDRDRDRDRDRRRDDDRHDDHRRHDDRHYDDHRYDRRSSVVVTPRIYVEPAPRTYYGPAPRSYGVGSIEADVQLALRREGYYRGPIDGDLGPGSRAAIRDYQFDHRLPLTGRIDNYLLRSLGL